MPKGIAEAKEKNTLQLHQFNKINENLVSVNSKNEQIQANDNDMTTSNFIFNKFGKNIVKMSEQNSYDYYEHVRENRSHSVIQRTKSARKDTIVRGTTVLQAHISVAIFLLPVMFLLYKCLKRFKTNIRYKIRIC